VGNPGTGKSTLLNGIVQKNLFASGLSFGKGLTSKLQIYQIGNNNYLGDTPGLSDMYMRINAAKAIEEALNKGGLYRLVFVVTLEGGRVKPDDSTTIKLILDAIPADIPFGILINKLERSARSILSVDPIVQKQVSTALLAGVPDRATNFFYAVKHCQELFGEHSVIPPSEISVGMIKWLRTLPFAHLPANQINPINTESYDELKIKTEKEIEALRADAVRTEKRFQELMERAKQQSEQRFQEMTNQHNDRIQNLQKEFEIAKRKDDQHAEHLQNLINQLRNAPPRVEHHYHRRRGCAVM
jgi:GTP-binding protein EngB required for normal cell division